MYNFSLFFFFSSRMFEPTFSLFRHFVYLDLSRNLVPRSSHSLRVSRHFEYISILVGNFGHVILLCARVFSRDAAILKGEKTLGTRLDTCSSQCINGANDAMSILFGRGITGSLRQVTTKKTKKKPRGH